MKPTSLSQDRSREGEGLRLILSSVGTEREALELSRLWVESHRAVCVTRLPKAHSVYPWEGALQDEVEILLLIKTFVQDEAELGTLLGSLAADHPYEEPEFLVLEVPAGAQGYLDWARAWWALGQEGAEKGEAGRAGAGRSEEGEDGA